MTTFQAIVYGLLHGFTQFLPVSQSAHELFFPHLLNWPQPSVPFHGALSLGALLAVLIYFRHDWASMISCFLQVILFRKRPMTLDERMPLFLGITTLPLAGAWYYAHESIEATEWGLLKIAALTAAFSIPLGMGEQFGRRTKGMFDWNWLDALIVGITQLMALIPGSDPLSGILTGGLFRNFNREAVAKYAFFAATPLLMARTILDLKGFSFHAAHPAESMTWLSFNMGILVSLLAALLAIGGFMRQVQRKSILQYVVYRWLLAAGMVAVYWWKNRTSY